MRLLPAAAAALLLYFAPNLLETYGRALLPVVAPVAAPAPRRAARPASKDSSTFSPSYARVPQVHSLNRWRKLPVRVYFDTGGAYTEDRRRQALAGFNLWSEATEGVVDYTVVDSPRQADVTVRFSPGRYIGNDRNTIGRTLIQAWGGSLRLARMDLATAGASADDLTETAAHEWGHALGINGHSDDPDDLMYFQTIRYLTPRGFPVPGRARREPTERDVNTLKTAYAPVFTRQ